MNAGQSEAFRFRATATGVSGGAHVYVDARNAARTVIVGVYSDAGGHPGTLISSGHVSSPKTGAWSTLSLTPAQLTSGGNYWIALLGEGGVFHYRDRARSSCTSNTSAQTGLGSLPATWKSGTGSSDCPVSAYVIGGGLLPASTPVPTPVPTPAPVNTAAPSISGSAMEGEVLSASAGSWSGSPTSISYQWQDCDAFGEACGSISGANAATYTLGYFDVGSTVRVVVTASNGGGSTQASSSVTALVADPPPPPAAAPVNIALPAISGIAMEGEMLSASAGSWSGSPTSFNYQWQDCESLSEACTDVSGATGSSYELGSSDVGHTVRVLVTATNAGGSTQAASATSLVVVQPPPPLPAAPVNTGPPAISGVAMEAEVLSATSGSWSGDPTSFSYQWEDCNASGKGCSNVGGATSATYTLGAAEVGGTVRVVVSASNAGGITKASSAASAVVVAIPPPPPVAPVNSELPAISGVPIEGEVLSASNGSWSGEPTSFAYQWQDCEALGAVCTDVGGATSSNYALTSSDVGSTVRVLVTASDAGGSAQAPSATTLLVTAALPAAPSNTALPTISGTATEGDLLTASSGSWTASPTSFAYQWQECNASGEGCTNVSGATSSSYSLTSLDVGGTVRVLVTATNAGGSTEASSAASATVQAAQPPAPSNSEPPTISGVTTQGQTLSTTNGVWSGSPTSFAYQWQDCNLAGEGCSNVGGATASTYTLTHTDVGRRIRVLVTATNGGGSTEAGSAASATVIAPSPSAPSNTVLPAISGSTTEGQTLSSTNGTWTGSPTGFAYQWQDCNSLGEGCSNVSGATSSSYTLGAGDVGSTVRVVVTASNLGGSASASSMVTATVAALPPAPPTNTAMPAVSGSTVEGQTVTTTTGTWLGNPTSYAYQWRHCNSSGRSCTADEGATGPSYTLAAADVGHTMRVMVSATNAGGTSSMSSPSTATVSAPPPSAPTNTSLPTISGTTTEGQSLSSSNGTWTGSPTSFAYQWQDCNSLGEECSNVAGATGSTHTLTSGEVAHTVRLVVTATNAGGSTEATSLASSTVAPLPASAPSNTTVPTISGTATEGQSLSSTNGTWNGSPTSFAYQWQDCNSSGAACSNASGANGSSYTLTGGDVGHTMRLVVTATNASGSTGATSNATSVVLATAPPAPTNTALPAISGSTTEGQTLSSTNGTWTGSPTGFAYQWQDCNAAGEACADVSGATATSYVLGSGDVGHTLRVTVTATNGGGSSAATSAQTAAVAASSSGGAGCTSTVSALTQVNGDLTAGAVVCLTAGSYGSLNITAKPSSVATLTAAPGAHVVLSGVDVESSNITVSQLHVTGQGIEFWQKSTESSLTNDAAEYNEVGPTNGYGISIFSKTSTPSEHIRIAHNEIHDTSSTSEGDALRFDGWKNVEVIGNDIYNIKECAAETCHTDTLQSYNADVATSGLLLERNYVHDCSSAQGFPFLKDGNISNVTIRDNLSLRMASKNQVTGIWIDETAPSLVVENNTYQGTSGSQIQTESGTGAAVVEHNVFDSLNEKSYSLTEDYDIFTGNNEWTFSLGAHSTKNANPGFMNTSIDDYRLASNPNHIGVDWSPSEQQYGPSS